MENQQAANLKRDYTYVRDENGVLYICNIKDLKKEDELTEEEKALCMVTQGDA